MRMIGVMVSVLIVIGLTLMFAMGGFGMTGQNVERPDGKGETLIGKVKYAAKDDVCRSNLGQARQFVQIATDPVDDLKPEDLNAAKVPPDFQKCAVGGEAYIYDAATGTVTCPHAGHEKY